VNVAFPGATQGAYTFSPSGSGATQVSALTNFRNGRYSVFQQAFGEPSQSQSNPNQGFFAQDEWRVRTSSTGLISNYLMERSGRARRRTLTSAVRPPPPIRGKFNSDSDCRFDIQETRMN